MPSPSFVGGGRSVRWISFSELFSDLVFVSALPRFSPTLLHHCTPDGAVLLATLAMGTLIVGAIRAGRPPVRWTEEWALKRSRSRSWGHAARPHALA
jgi:hypothetical protein